MKGRTGDDGASGEPGTRGSQGEPGKDGTPGIAGEDGPPVRNNDNQTLRICNSNQPILHCILLNLSCTKNNVFH